MQHILNISFCTYFIYIINDRILKNVINSKYNNIIFLLIEQLIKQYYDDYIIPANIIISSAISNYSIDVFDKNIVTEFIILYSVTRIVYSVLLIIMNIYVPTFNNIHPIHKKMYVIKNFVKSCTLAGLCLFIPILIKNVIHKTFDINFFKRCTIYYIINDIIGLLVVNKLPRTTVIHHITTTLCGLFTQFKSDPNLDIITLIIIYATFSSLAFIVNFYLGYRIFSNNVHRKRILSISSFWIYLITCMINWLIQIYLAYELLYISISQFSLYIIFLTSVARDDIILMKWLYDDHNKFINNNNNTE